MFSLFCRLTTRSQGFSRLEPVKIFATSKDDVGPSMTAVLGLRRSRIRTKPIIKITKTSQILSMPSVPTKDLGALATRATEGYPSSLVEQDRLRSGTNPLSSTTTPNGQGFCYRTYSVCPCLESSQKHSQIVCYHHFASFCPITMAYWRR